MMWSRVVETVFKMMAVILPSLFSYQAGKKSVESDMKDNTIKDAKKRQEIEVDIAKTYSDPVARQRLRDKWSE